MTPVESIALARAYIALSNAHRCDLIRPMFAAHAVYCSSVVGEHRGVDAIIDMMAGFFDRYPDVNWQCSEFRCDGSRVSFDFELSARDTPDGSPLYRAGIEHIDFDRNGMIKWLEVQAVQDIESALPSSSEPRHAKPDP